MSVYQYIAKTASGQQVTGQVQADSEAAVLSILDEQKLYPVEVTPDQAKSPQLAPGRVRLRDVGVMYGQLGDLLQAGVPLLRGLEILSRVVTNRRLGNVMLTVRKDVAAGAPLADAISFHPRVFAPLHAAMIRAGERAGFLEDVLSNLAEFIERQDELRGKVLGAMIYPLILTVLGSAAVLGILILLVPQFKPVFEGMSLPAPTVFLFALSDILILHWPIVLAGTAMIVLAVLSWARSRAGRLSWDRWRVRIPVFGLAVRMVAVTRFCRILGTMLANGVPILQALAISKDATGSAVLSESIEQAIESVRAGETLAAPLAQSGIFPPQILEMICVAEESNQMEKVLVQIADTFERRTNRQVDQAVRLIEPLILVLIAAVIGFVATGLMFPIFKMAQTLG